MPITLTINGETAQDILGELKTLAQNLTGNTTKVEMKWVNAADLPTSVNDGCGTRVVADPHGYEPNNIVSDAPINPEDNAVVIEDKPKRKRRTKEEMEAERAAGLPPQEGDPDLEPVSSAPVDDIMSDVVAAPQATEEKPDVIRREDLQTLVGKIIRNRKLSPAELKQAYIDIGGAPQLAAIDGAHMEALYNFLAEKLQA
jgi:hypothetical protein